MTTKVIITPLPILLTCTDSTVTTPTPPAPLTPHQTGPYPLVPFIAGVFVHPAPVPLTPIRILPPMLHLRQVTRNTTIQYGTHGDIPTPLPTPALQCNVPHQGVAGQAGEGPGPAGGVASSIKKTVRERRCLTSSWEKRKLSYHPLIMNGIY